MALQLLIGDKLQKVSWLNLTDPKTGEKLFPKAKAEDTPRPVIFELLGLPWDHDNNKLMIPKSKGVKPVFEVLNDKGEVEIWRLYETKQEKVISGRTHISYKIGGAKNIEITGAQLVIDPKRDPALIMGLLNHPKRGTDFELLDKEKKATRDIAVAKDALRLQNAIMNEESKEYIPSDALVQVMTDLKITNADKISTEPERRKRLLAFIGRPEGKEAFAKLLDSLKAVEA